MATQGEIAAHLDLSARHVRELMRDGVIPKGARGDHDVDRCRVAYIRHLRAIASGHKSEDGKLDLVAERAREASERADKLEMENAVTRGELISIADYRSSARVIMAGIRTRVTSLGAKLQHKLAAESKPRECRRLIDAAHREALEDLAELEVVKDADGSPDS